ncbi:MAG: outer membrane beta-barrel protein [Bacteroidales bacterium]|nr:outer membrane beta-barrel protein [Bacteroidales bacterium]
MVKNESHIDVLFREGLKDIEVLPPESVWENIKPAAGKRANRIILFRIAAGLAILVSLGMMAYMFTSLPETGSRNQLASGDGNDMSDLFDAGYIGLNVRTAELAETDQDEDQAVGITRNTEVSDEDITDDTPFLINYNSGVKLDDTQKPASSLSGFAEYDENVKLKTRQPAFIASGLSPVAQAEETAKERKWRFGAMISPTYLSSNSGLQGVSPTGVNNESAILSYSGGFSVSYKMTGRLSIQSGFFYSSLSRKVEGVASYSGFSAFASSKSGTIFGVNTSSGTVNSTNNDVYLADIASSRINDYSLYDNFDPLKSDLIPFGSQLKQSFEYLEIPLLLKYKIIDGKMDFNVLGGMSYNFLIANNAWAIGDEGSSILLGTTEGLENLIFSSSLGLSMEYDLNEKLTFNLEPQLRYFLNSGGDLGSGNPYTFGVFSGMHFRF